MKYFPSEFNEMLFSLCAFPQKFPLWRISRQSLGNRKDPGSFRNQSEAIEPGVADQELSLYTEKGHCLKLGRVGSSALK